MKIIAILCALILLACAVTMHPLVFAIGCPIAAIGIICMLYCNYKETISVRDKLDELSEKIADSEKVLQATGDMEFKTTTESGKTAVCKHFALRQRRTVFARFFFRQAENRKFSAVNSPCLSDRIQMA